MKLRWICLLSIGVMLVPTLAVARRPTHVTHNCTKAKIKPRRILFACADGGYYVTRLAWKAWYRRRAVARGVFHLNDCDPSCAEGTFHKRRGRLVLRRRLWCPEIDKFVFKRARVRYKRTLNGRKRESFRLFCPL